MCSFSDEYKTKPVDLSTSKCDSCRRVCPEAYADLMAKFTAAAKERDELRRKVPSWISVNDRKPAEGQRTIITKIEYEKTIVDFFRYWSCVGFPSTATHWMPLPDPAEVDDGID